jgi:hypothetical protein
MAGAGESHAFRTYDQLLIQVMGDCLEIVQRFAAWISEFNSFRTILLGMITVSIKQMIRAELKNSANFLHA